MTTDNIRPRALVRQTMRSLRPEDGDIIIIKVGTPMAHELRIAELQTHLQRTGRRNCIVGVVYEFDDLTVLNEADMNRLGWMRIANWQKTDSEVQS